MQPHGGNLYQHPLVSQGPSSTPSPPSWVFSESGDSPFTPSTSNSPLPTNDARVASEGPEDSFPCPYIGCGEIVSDTSLAPHYRSYHTPEGAKTVSCGTCDLTMQVTSRIKHIRSKHLQTLTTKCPIGKQIFSRRDAAKRHAEGGCDGSCEGQPAVRVSKPRSKPNPKPRPRCKRRREDEDEDEGEGGNSRTRKRAVTRRR